MYGCENWTVKKTELWRIDAFELWCLRRVLRVPWTARTSNQSILKEISPGVSLEGMMLKLKFQYFSHLMRRVDSLEKTDAGRDWGQEKGMTEDEMAGWHHWLDGRESEWTPGVGDWQGGLVCCDPRGHRVGHDWVTELNRTMVCANKDNCTSFFLSNLILFLLFLSVLIRTSSPLSRLIYHKIKVARASILALFPRLWDSAFHN